MQQAGGIILATEILDAARFMGARRAWNSVY
jgi:hypothetical protein